MDHLRHFHREVVAFEAAARLAVGSGTAVRVPSCPDWTVSDLVFHLGSVHRLVAGVVRARLTAPPDTSATSQQQPGPVTDELVDWFAAGAADLEAAFREADPTEEVWTWWYDRTVGFWIRMQTIEAAVHRWDAQASVGVPDPIPAELAADAVGQTLEIMAPARRAMRQAPPGQGERYAFRSTDGEGAWSVCFQGATVEWTHSAQPAEVVLEGTTSELMLFLWGRVPADALHVSGDHEVLDRYFTLVPKV